MRREYLAIWKETVIRTMAIGCPELSLGRTSSSRSAIAIRNRKEVHYHWHPGPGRLEFFFSFVAGRRDSFNGIAGWSEDGKRDRAILLVNRPPFDATILSQSVAWTDIQSLSGQLDNKESMIIGDWVVSPVRNADRMSDQALFEAFLAVENREIPEDEAKILVDSVVARAAADVRRLVLPWFQAKLEVVKGLQGLGVFGDGSALISEHSST